ncbi:tetratricopeptide repeat protein [Ferrovibrio terrae]|uniref:O-linked N-acetylglucosamine transferase, SPINDLY family protein n=1 Tax=Ferrovibrio terrae TaxID=2594003 RepID=UPI003137F726
MSETTVESAKARFMQGLEALGREDFAAAVDHLRAALALMPDRPSILTNLSGALLRLGAAAEATALAERAVALEPGMAEAWLNLANGREQLRRIPEAMAACDRALGLKPDYADAWCTRGNLLAAQRRPAEAITAYDRALGLRPGFAEAHANRGHAHHDLQHFDAALADYTAALRLRPALPGLAGRRLQSRMQLCHWDGLEQETGDVLQQIAAGKAAATPLTLLATPATPAQQLACAALHARSGWPQPAQALPAYTGHDRIRLGYFSADLHGHATAWLMAELFELHDRSTFEVFAFSYGPQSQDAMRQRLRAGFDHFIEIGALDDAAAATLARQHEIDIAIDLKGFTQEARPGIFAHRAAPLQVSYIGYPGSMGAAWIDYLLADAVTVPQQQRPHYSEAVVRLPHSYQANDRKRVIASETPTRQQAGLPAEGFVFCCFNNSFKITPDVFALWMRLLHAVPGSVLWLFASHESTMGNLRKAAQGYGIDPARLVFAAPLPLPQHLARHRLADLFLDTLHYNAHTTASDALWAGLPVLTRPGESFASRVGASLLGAIGLPELIAGSLEAYETLALRLATHPSELAMIKAKLAAQRDTAPLFDTPRFTRHVEAAFRQMQAQQRAGRAPEDFSVAAD